MYFLGFLHSWTCKNRPYADTYWRLRAFWAGAKRKGDASTPPKRCPSANLWFDMWWLGAESDSERLEF